MAKPKENELGLGQVADEEEVPLNEIEDIGEEEKKESLADKAGRKIREFNEEMKTRMAVEKEKRELQAEERGRRSEEEYHRKQREVARRQKEMDLRAQMTYIKKKEQEMKMARMKPILDALGMNRKRSPARPGPRHSNRLIIGGPSGRSNIIMGGTGGGRANSLLMGSGGHSGAANLLMGRGKKRKGGGFVL